MSEVGGGEIGDGGWEMEIRGRMSEVRGLRRGDGRCKPKGLKFRVESSMRLTFEAGTNQ